MYGQNRLRQNWPTCKSKPPSQSIYLSSAVKLCMNHFSEINFLPPQLLGSQSHLCWVCRFAPIHQKEDINHAVCSSILLSLIYPTLFNTLNMSLFFSSRVDWLLSYYIVNLSYQVSTCCHVMQFISTTYYYYISILQCHLLLPYCQRFFVVISNAAAIS